MGVFAIQSKISQVALEVAQRQQVLYNTSARWSRRAQVTYRSLTNPNADKPLVKMANLDMRDKGDGEDVELGTKGNPIIVDDEDVGETL